MKGDLLARAEAWLQKRKDAGCNPTQSSTIITELLAALREASLDTLLLDWFEKNPKNIYPVTLLGGRNPPEGRWVFDWPPGIRRNSLREAITVAMKGAEHDY